MIIGSPASVRVGLKQVSKHLRRTLIIPAWPVGGMPWRLFTQLRGRGTKTTNTNLVSAQLWQNCSTFFAFSMLSKTFVAQMSM
jgi:hypothetical protein